MVFLKVLKLPRLLYKTCFKLKIRISLELSSIKFGHFMASGFVLPLGIRIRERKVIENPCVSGTPLLTTVCKTYDKWPRINLDVKQSTTFFFF